MGNAHRGRPKGRTLGKVPQKTNRQRASSIGTGVRVKRRGKSPPPSRRREGQGKPGEEQARIGGEELSVPTRKAKPRVGRLSPSATKGRDKWSHTTKVGLPPPAPKIAKWAKLISKDEPLCPSTEVNYPTNGCCAGFSHGVCMLNKGHRGPHIMSGNLGLPGRAVPYRVTWYGDMRTLYNGLRN